MPRLVSAGSVPGSIAENSGPTDWAGTLALIGDTAALLGVSTLGPDALDFAATYQPLTHTIRIAPAAPLDYEAFIAAGKPPQVTLQLAFSFTDHTTLIDPQSYAVSVLNQHDTPPQALTFASGGSVAAGAIGAVIGTLAVTDPDWSDPFTYSFTPDDAWRFQVVGNTLQLQSGVNLGLDDIPGRPVIIDVSDGTLDAAFMLDIIVTAPVAPVPPVVSVPPAVNTIDLTGPRALYTLNLTDGAANIGLLSSTGVTYNSRALMGDAIGNDQVVSFLSAENLQFADGRLVFDPGDPIGQVERMYLSALGRDADPLGLHGWTRYLEQGHSILELAQQFVGSAEFQARYPALDTAGYVTLLYQNTLGRAPDPAGLAGWTAAMDAGLSRAQMLTYFSESAEHYLDTAALWTHGLFDYSDAGAEVLRFYDAAFGRLPDEPGWAAWTAALQGGMPLSGLAAAFPASLEFQLRYPNVDNAGYVTLLYQNCLHRAPDQAGQDAWTAELNSGALDRTQMLLVFSDCLEHQMQTVAHVADGAMFL